MAVWVFLNAPAQSTVALAMNASQTTAVLASSASFGNPTGVQQIPLVIFDTGSPSWNANNPYATNWEYAGETTNVVGTNTLTLTRGIAGTTGKAFFAGATIAAVPIAEMFAADGTGAFVRTEAAKARVYRSSAQSYTSNSAFVVLHLDLKDYDVNNMYDAVTNFAFTVPFAGVYHINARQSVTVTSIRCILSVFKNGAEMLRGTDVTQAGSPASLTVSGDLKLALNDVIDLRIFIASAAAQSLETGIAISYFDIAYRGS